MPEVLNYNVVLVGTGLPVAPIRLQDFDFDGHPLEEQVRFPVLVAATAREYVLNVTEERAQFGAVSSPVTDERLETIVRNAVAYLDDYAGRRSITAVGHNFTLRLGPDEFSSEAMLRSLVPTARLAELLNVDALPHGEIAFDFHVGAEDRARLRAVLLVDDDDRVITDFNFHFDSATRDDSPAEQVSRLGESVRYAEAIVERLCTMPNDLQAGALT